MTQSNNPDFNYTFDISDLKLDDIIDTDDTITINLDETYSTTTIDTVSVDFYNKEFVDCMPNVHTIDNMCKEYPALAKAYENFKTIYKMCEQDYKGKVQAGELDDDIPF